MRTLENSLRPVFAPPAFATGELPAPKKPLPVRLKHALSSAAEVLEGTCAALDVGAPYSAQAVAKALNEAAATCEETGLPPIDPRLLRTAARAYLGGAATEAAARNAAQLLRAAADRVTL